MHRVECSEIYGADVSSQWGHDPNLRATIKNGLAETIGQMLRVRDLIDFVITTEPNGDTRITASVLAERTGDEK